MITIFFVLLGCGAGFLIDPVFGTLMSFVVIGSVILVYVSDRAGLLFDK